MIKLSNTVSAGIFLLSAISFYAIGDTRMAKKRKTLPKDFKELIEKKDINALKAIFDNCELDARESGYAGGTALTLYGVPDELVRWLVEQGANINAADDTYFRTPLHIHCMRFSGNIDILLELGADVNAKDKYGETPLHFAAGSSFNPERVRKLLVKGADPFAKNSSKETPFTNALRRTENMHIENMVIISKIFLELEVPAPEDAKAIITKIGENFEFHRERFNKEMLPATDAALSELYRLFDVTPVKKRVMHDGVSPIIVKAGKWEDQYAELWDLLIPSSGSAKTVQGEVIRITGKVRDEIYRNGGANWDSHFKKMLDALLVYLRSSVPLDDTLFEEASAIAKEVRRLGDGDEELSRLCELGLKWVITNPTPIPLKKPDYDR